MSMFGSKLRTAGDNRFVHWCPGCDEAHQIPTGTGDGPRWSFNGSKESPTFNPSVRIRYPANPDAEEEYKEWRTERVCHYFIRDGQIDFCTDSTHNLKGQTVELPDIPEDWKD